MMSDDDDKRYVDSTRLIEEVRKRPGLYDPTLDMERDDKMRMWKEIGSDVYEDWDEINKAEAYDRVLELQRRWRSFRDAVNRELRNRKKSTNKNRKPYRYFNQLKFLISESELAALDEDSDTIDNEALESNIPIQVPKKKIRKSTPAKRPSTPQITKQEVTLFPVDVKESSIMVNMEDDSDSDKLFLLSFVQELRKLPTHIKMWARAEIANVMQRAVNCNYNNRMPGESSLYEPDVLEIKQQKPSSHDNAALDNII